MGLHATAWTLAEQLHLSAPTVAQLLQGLSTDTRRTTIVLPDLQGSATPGELSELIAAFLALDHVRVIVEVDTESAAARRLEAFGPAVMDLDQEHWTDGYRLALWRRQYSDRPVPSADSEARAEMEPSLDDPADVLAADALYVTTRYESSTHDHGGLRAAWFRVGQALISEEDSTTRGLLLLAALGDSADPRLRGTLAGYTADAPWQLVWSSVDGDVLPPWPGPARTLTVSRTKTPVLLIADQQGTVRSLGLVDAEPVGRLPRAFGTVGALAALDDGTVLALTEQGGLRAQRSATTPTPGIRALLEESTDPTEELVHTVRAHLDSHPAHALAASSRVVVTGHQSGAVHVFSAHNASRDPQAHCAHAHSVSALAVMDTEPSDGSMESCGSSYVYSGGIDGQVRGWDPGNTAAETVVAARPLPVTALAAASTPGGPALAISWADGHIEHHRPRTHEVHTLHLGPAVNALALTAGGDLVIGMDHMVVCLRPL
ncbi:hypothetical protein ACFVQ0_09815 [Streptomyces sp. NPDC057900]|uniref:hypothetical protein n=1 Tax=Streptomyces sp. NPDC057900 TaxID=3346274 RepID=UPI0036EF6E7E